MPKLTWDIDSLATAMKITKEDVREYFTDGRRVSFIIERRLAYEVFHGKLPKSEGAGYDLIDKDDGLWEVRSITDGGVYFCPSNMVGKGRQFNEAGFLRKLNQIRGYALADVVGFPNVPFWIINKNIVRKWWDEGKLGENSKISYKKAIQLLKNQRI